jgi:hypothetical protein
MYPYLIEERAPFFCLIDCFFKLRGNVTAYCKLNPAKAGVFSFVITVREQIMLIPRPYPSEAGRFLPSQGEKRGLVSNTLNCSYPAGTLPSLNSV